MSTPNTALPPAGPSLRLDDLLLALVAGAALFVALPMLFPGMPFAGYCLRFFLPLWLIGGVIFGGPLVRGRPGWFRVGGRFARGRLGELGGGFYGAVALTIFLGLEFDRLFEQWAGLVESESIRDLIRNLIHELFDFGIASIVNFVTAVGWPGLHDKAFAGRQFWPAVAVGAGVFFAARGVVEALPRRAPPPASGPQP